MVIKFIHLLLTKLRLSNPWRYKAPFLMSVPYWMVLVGGLAPEKAAWGFLFSCLTILGIAGFGYLVNDYTDREEDRKAGKTNVIDGMPMPSIGLLLLLFLALAILPWVFFFPVDGLSLGLLVSEFCLFILYSLPPFRLKERGWWGVACDALYAHVVPALLAANTFYLLGPQRYPHFFYFLLALGAWQMVLGIRNILLHQLADLDNDLASGATTQVAATGRETTHRRLRDILLPLELISFSLFGLVLSLKWPYLGLFYLLFALQVLGKHRILWGKALPTALRQRMYIFLDDFYLEWIPVIFLGLLAWANPWFLILLAAHLLLFRNAVRTLARDLWGKFAPKFGAA